MARLLALVCSTVASATVLGSGWPTSGTESGQVRVYSWTQAQEVGCLTKDGSWTASGNCDTFTAEATGPIYVDQSWTQLEIRNSAGNRCWFPDGTKFACDASVDHDLWMHADNYKADSQWPSLLVASDSVTEITESSSCPRPCAGQLRTPRRRCALRSERGCSTRQGTDPGWQQLPAHLG